MTWPSCPTPAKTGNSISRGFDTGGVESRSGAELDAFVFTERGIYRPGDDIHIGLIVKQTRLGRETRWTPRGDRGHRTLAAQPWQVRKLALPPMGFAETSYQTVYESPTGVYGINAYLVRDGKRGVLLGSTSVNVKEFLPDRMKIESHLSKETVAAGSLPTMCAVPSRCAISMALPPRSAG
jgi:uncharacterized protein YfaS (alpha-2-macroglobulin family)